jgi:LAO/AO transport system kinase
LLAARSRHMARVSADPAGGDDLAGRVLAGDKRAIAQAITKVESGELPGRELLARLYPFTGQAHVIGVTGSPGTGKSTLVAAMAQVYRSRGAKVGIVAVDPTSPFSGGAILGDRIRMRDLAGDPGVFIRSMASRGHLGGVAETTSDVVRVLDAAGCGVIIVETVGVGQSEVDIVRMAHTVVVVEAPGLGDDVQALKAGLMEIADILVVNKSDLPGADALVSTLQAATALAAGQARYAGHHQLEAAATTQPMDGSPDRRAVAEDSVESWRILVKEAAALHRQGIEELVAAIDAHRRYLQASGLWRRRERSRVESDLATFVRQALFRRLMERLTAGEWEDLIEAVVNRQLDPRTAAEQVVEQQFGASE